MMIYVICPKNSTDSDVINEFISGYGVDNIDLNHVRHSGINYESVNNRYRIMSDYAKDFLEIRVITMAISKKA